jgi:hypothetical protein
MSILREVKRFTSGFGLLITGLLIMSPGMTYASGPNPRLTASIDCLQVSIAAVALGRPTAGRVDFAATE